MSSVGCARRASIICQKYWKSSLRERSAVSAAVSPCCWILGIVRADGFVGPLEELRPILARGAEEVAEHGERESGGDARHKVGLALASVGGELVEHVAGDALDRLGEPLQLTRREAAADEPPEAPVLGRVHIDQVPGGRRFVVEGFEAGEYRRGAGRSGTPLRVLRDRDDVGVFRDRPERLDPALRREPPDRRLAPQPGPGVVRDSRWLVGLVADDVERVEVGHGGPPVGGGIIARPGWQTRRGSRWGLSLCPCDRYSRNDMNYRVNLFRPIREESPRASEDELTARARAAFDGAASVGPASASQVSLSHRPGWRSRRMN